MGAPAGERFLNTARDCFANSIWIAETNLALCRMYIYINRGRIEFEKKKRDRVLALHQRRVIPLAHGGGDERAFDRAAFHGHGLLGASLSAHSSLPDESADSDARRAFAVQRKQLCQQLVSIKITDSIAEGGGGGQLKNNAIVARESERNTGVADRLQMELMLDVAALGIF